MAEAYNHFVVNKDEQQHTAFRLVYMEGLPLAEQVPIVPLITCCPSLEPCLISTGATKKQLFALLRSGETVNSADVLVMPHGATCGELIYAAEKSVIVHVSAFKGRKVFAAESAIHMATSMLKRVWMDRPHGI